MMDVRTFLLLARTGLFLVGCNNGSPGNPTEDEQVYGASVNADDAIPAPAVAAEPPRYHNRRVTVDGRIEARADNGCTIHLDTEDGPPLRIESVRTNDDGCAWQVPAPLDGIAAAVGTLRAENDTLRLTANGVQVTPVQVAAPDS